MCHVLSLERFVISNEAGDVALGSTRCECAGQSKDDGLLVSKQLWE
jgi:hypothetical protein